MPFLGHHQQQRMAAPEAAFGFPEPLAEAPADAPAPGQKAKQPRRLVRIGEMHPGRGPKRAKTRAQTQRLWADLAREQVVLADQQIVVVVIKGHRHAVIAEQQIGQRARTDLLAGHDMGHDGLEKGLVGDPAAGKEPQHVAAAVAKGQHLLDGLPAQAPPLRADHHLNIGRRPARDSQPFLQIIAGIEQPLVLALVEPVVIAQPLVLEAGLDPVRAVEIKAFDIIAILRVQKGMGVFCRLDRHAIAREHVEMRGVRKGRDGGAHRAQRGGDQRPLAPAAFPAPCRKGDRGMIRQRPTDLLIIARTGAGIKVNRHIIAGSGQPQRLRDDPFGVLVTQENKGNARHLNVIPPGRCRKAHATG